MKKVIKKDSAETESSEQKSTQIVAQSTEKVNKPPFSKGQIELIKRTVAKGATDDELALFLIVANKSGLDPFSKQIHFVKRKQKQKDGSYIEVGSIQAGIDGYRAIAERSGTYAGSDDVVYDSEESKNPNKASVTVYRIIQGVRVPFTASARWKEYCPASPMDFMWNKMPYLMLGKVAEALALRKAFPNDLSGLHIDEEMERTGIVITDAKIVTVAPKEEVKQIEEKPSPLINLFRTANEFGAIKGQEAIFIQETLNTNIEWDALTDMDIAKIRTQLMAKCVKNGVV